MGYYTGNGTTSSGGSNVAPFHTYLWNGFHTVYQRTTTTVTQKNGVSLAAAKAEQGDCNLSSHTFTIGSSYYNAYNCKGTQKHVNYAQINGSNLYALTIVNESLAAKLDNGNWVT